MVNPRDIAGERKKKKKKKKKHTHTHTHKNKKQQQQQKNLVRIGRESVLGLPHSRRPP